jgi:small conductance mechanosensitive channel
VFGTVDPAGLQEACGANPSFICDRIYRATTNVGLAKTVDFLVSRPLKILVVLLVAFGAAWLARRAIRRFAHGIAHRAENHDGNLRAAARAQTLASVLNSLASAVIYGLAMLTILGEVGINLGPLIAGAGIVGVAVGFGAQSLVKDFLSGLFMLIEDQYGVGDVIDVGEATGTVESVTLRSTRLRDVNGTVWHVPNGEIRRVGNKSQLWSRAVLDVVVAPGTDVDRASEVLAAVGDELAADVEWTKHIIEPPEVWGVEDINASGITLRLVVKTMPGSKLAVLRELRARIKVAFEREGIQLPAPPIAAAPPPA